MKQSMVIVGSAALLLSVAGTVSAQNVFRGVASTADGYSTYDADMIDIENVSQTGAGVYVAVLDTGLAPNWKDYFPSARIAEKLGKGFHQSVSFKAQQDECGLGVEVGTLRETTFIGSRGSEHGTHVASTILGFFYRSNSDAAGGFPIPPIMVRGIAPDVTVIPVKVLADYQIPALPKCDDPDVPKEAQLAVFGTDAMVAAGINYVTDLAIAGYRPMVINMSLGGSELDDVEKAALDRAIANGVIIVASAGNEGEEGMGFPGAYAPVISVAAGGWNNAWVSPDESEIYRMFWLKNGNDFVPPLYADSGEVPEPTPVESGILNDAFYIADFSSRELPGQELDVAAPGVWIRGPFAGFPGYSHLPWWSKGIGDLVSVGNPGNFYYVSGTSMAAPHVAATAALMLEKNPALTQAEVETILKETAIPVPPGTGGDVRITNGFEDLQVWGADATGAGLIQADEAVDAVN
ncbi:MAG TPA: S8 family serine peptidase [Steroidobacteraceae bacterium]|nr:S8 family serine peptidase [Steroidobacteraceae bacterium]